MSKLNKTIIALLSVGAIVALTLTEVSRAKTKSVPKPAASEWSQFRGPNGTGVAETTGLPTEFGPTTNVVWKTALPPGHSSPVLTRDRIFITAHSKEKDNHKLFVICLDRQSGKLLWQREVPRSRDGRLQNVNGPASPSPVTDGTNVYAFFQEFGLISFGQGTLEVAAWTFQHVLWIWCVAHNRGRQVDIARRSGQSQFVPHCGR